MAESPVVVVGGGLAGISAAACLADAGRQVVLLERRPRLGGAAFSFVRNGLVIDNGQHVFLRCCTAYLDLLERLRVRDRVHLQPRLDIPVLSPDGRTARLRRTPGLPAPVHLTNALARYGLLNPADRARAVRGALALRRLDPADRSLDSQALGPYLRAHGQNERTIAALWGIIATATLNLDPQYASLALAAKVFRTGLLDSAPAADIGYAAVPLGDLHSVGAAAALHARGVDVRTDSTVIEILPNRSVQASGPDGMHSWPAEQVVLAVPPQAAFTALPALRQSAAAPAERLESSPIVNVHVVYERRVTELPFAAAVQSPVQWFFDRTDSSGLRGRDRAAQYLAITVSAADDILGQPRRELAERFVAELARLVPRARGVPVRDVFVTREKRATFRQASGTWALRPGPDAAPDGVVLAGAWTDTGWPDTMEGAVRSGIAAADTVLARSSTYVSPPIAASVPVNRPLAGKAAGGERS